MPQVARNGNDLGGFNLTGGPQGITPVDSPGFGNNAVGLDRRLPAGELPDDREQARVFYWTALLLLLFTVFCSLRLRDSRLGRAWIAIREDEIAASAMGVPLMRTKTWAYACGAFFGGLAGAYFAAFKSSTFPQDFFFNISVFILCMVILGGMGNVWGVILGAAFLSYLNQEGLANTGAWINLHFGTHIDVPKYSCGIYGVIIVLVMLLRPQGLLPSARRKRELELGIHDEYEPTTWRRLMANLLEATGMRKEFGGLVAVSDVDFVIPQGAIVSLIGPNGAGKTTFFNMITGVYKPTSGSVVFDGNDVTAKPPHAVTERGIGRTFQNIRLFQDMTALENVLVGMHSRLQGGIVGSILHTPRVQREEAAGRQTAASCSTYCTLGGHEQDYGHATCRTATSGGSRWRARSRQSRSCCCSTSRPPA